MLRTRACCSRGQLPRAGGVGALESAAHAGEQATRACSTICMCTRSRSTPHCARQHAAPHPYLILYALLPARPAVGRGRPVVCGGVHSGAARGRAAQGHSAQRQWGQAPVGAAWCVPVCSGVWRCAGGLRSYKAGTSCTPCHESFCLGAAAAAAQLLTCNAARPFAQRTWMWQPHRATRSSAAHLSPLWEHAVRGGVRLFAVWLCQVARPRASCRRGCRCMHGTRACSQTHSKAAQRAPQRPPRARAQRQPLEHRP